jgi:enoyl-[acyl-carrier protein] reductase II
MCLGADVVAMESRFAITKESLLAQQMKDIVSNNEIDGGIILKVILYGKNFDGILARVLKRKESLRFNAKQEYTIVKRSSWADHSM